MSGSTEAEASVTGRVAPGWPRAALLSLADKQGAVALAQRLATNGTRIIASGGTAKHLAAAGLEVTAVESLTGFPDLLGGRVKTLHPSVHAPILARRALASDMRELEARHLEPIDLVAVTLYPFESRAPELDEAAAVEEIDIGGVALLRAAAKNFTDVVVLHDPAQYAAVADALARGMTLDERRQLAVSAFERTSRYDAAIAGDLARRGGAAPSPSAATRPESPASPALPERFVLDLVRVRSLRYGENPHQEAALYAATGSHAALHAAREGKELSYNNLLDLEAAVRLAGRFDRPACVIVKHNEPCGVAVHDDLTSAYRAAVAADPLSAFGGIVAFNRPLAAGTAAEVAKQFVECVAAPAIDEEARAALAARKQLRVLTLSAADVAPEMGFVPRAVGPWTLVQRDAAGDAPPWRAATRRAPTSDELSALRFAWEVVAAARSNAIVIARSGALLGLGSGQTSRVDAVDLAITKARRAGHAVAGAVLASDGFFPFADNIEHAAAAGLRAIVQPGGSIRDDEVIAACDAAGIAMMFTDRRTFRH